MQLKTDEKGNEDRNHNDYDQVVGCGVYVCRFLKGCRPCFGNKIFLFDLPIALDPHLLGCGLVSGFVQLDGTTNCNCDALRSLALA